MFGSQERVGGKAITKSKNYPKHKKRAGIIGPLELPLWLQPTQREGQVESKHQEQHLEGEEGGKGRNNMKSNRRSTQIPFVAGIECNLLFHMGGHNPTQAPQVERCDLVRILQKP